jgi:hypothetical protein
MVTKASANLARKVRMRALSARNEVVRKFELSDEMLDQNVEVGGGSCQSTQIDRSLCTS